MAKNFTQFQQISGSHTVDGSNNVTRTTGATKDMHVVGYSADQPDGERRFTIESLLFTAAPSSIGLEHVTNESKATMFTDPTFTGTATASNLYVANDLSVAGNQAISNTLTLDVSAGVFENTNTSDALHVAQLDTSSSFNIAKFITGTNPAMIIDAGGTIAVGCDTNIVDPTVAMHIEGTLYATSLSAGPGSSINGRNVNQDGIKLDTMQMYADTTVLNLSTVKADMQAIADAGIHPQAATISPSAGFDLLEDGETYSKVLALSAGPSNDYMNANGLTSISSALTFGGSGHGLWDASIQKIKSIEIGADKTGAHSGDIILNEVPDGPWAGHVNTTYVKFLSAEREKLANIRQVSSQLYAGDSGLDLTATHIVSAYHDQYSDYWSSADENEYRNTIIPAVTGAVTNTLSAGNPQITNPGVANLTSVTSTSVNTSSLTASTNVYVVSAGEVLQGVSHVLDIDDNEYHFVNGILVRVIT